MILDQNGYSMPHSIIFQQIFETLYKSFGPQNWWPADSPFEVMIGAILTQNTAWRNVEKAITGLGEIGDLTPEAVLSLPIERLEETIRPSGYFRQKSARLQGFCRFLQEQYGGSIPAMEGVATRDLRGQLLSLNGIGPETADSILLYALGRPMFVVDAYTIRLLSRHGLCSAKGKYHEIQNLFLENLDHDVALYNEFHALIVKHGKEQCRKNNPLCIDCPLKDFCKYVK